MSKLLKNAAPLQPLVPTFLLPNPHPALASLPPLALPRVSRRFDPNWEPCVPFFSDPGHTVPTRTLYRSLLREVGRFPSSPAKGGDAGSSTRPYSDGIANVKSISSDPDESMQAGPSSSTRMHLLDSGVKSELDAPIGAKERKRVGLPALKRRIKRDWRKWRGKTSIPQVSEFLAGQHDLLRDLVLAGTAPPGDPPRATETSAPPSPAQPERSRLSILASRAPSFSTYTSPASNHHPPGSDAHIALLRTHLAELESRLAHQNNQRRAAEDRRVLTPAPKAHLTGGFLRPTILNAPLPRLKPQPVGISMMIHARLRARERRREKRLEMLAWAEDYAAEAEFLRGLGAGAADAPLTGLGPDYAGSEGTEAGEGEGVGGAWRRGGGNMARYERKDALRRAGTGDLWSSRRGHVDPQSRTDREGEGAGAGAAGIDLGKWAWTVGWRHATYQAVKFFDEGFQRDTRRAGMRFKVGMVRRVKRAKARRQAHLKARANERREQLASAKEAVGGRGA